MAIVRSACLCLLATLLSACSTIADHLQGSLTPPAGYGFAIVSLTARAFDQDSATAGLRIENDKGERVANGFASMNTDTVFGAEGMSPVDGKLQLFTLPPGHYRLVDAWGNWFEDVGWTRQWRSVSLPVNAGFDVYSGRSVYLGEIFLDLSYRPELKLSNQQDRDFGHIRRVWKVQDLSVVDVHPLQAETASAAK